MLIIIVPTSCSKEDDPYHIDKTYAADDFVKTDRNIRAMVEELEKKLSQ